MKKWIWCQRDSSWAILGKNKFQHYIEVKVKNVDLHKVIDVITEYFNLKKD
jgi:hypothetical protein